MAFVATVSICLPKGVVVLTDTSFAAHPGPICAGEDPFVVTTPSAPDQSRSAGRIPPRPVVWEEEVSPSAQRRRYLSSLIKDIEDWNQNGANR
jgi:N-methylhydantoinase A/oxoprolinase/acetone carboxylase beta subunit